VSGQQEGSLSDTFGQPALSGLLRRRTPGPLDPEPAPAAEPASVADSHTDQQADSGADQQTNRSTDSGPSRQTTKAAAHSKSVPAARQVRSAPTAHDQDGNSEVTTQVSVYLLPDAIQAARRVRGRRTNAELAWEAIDATHQRLGELLATRHGGAPRPGSLFPARQTGGRPGAVGEARRALWSMKATPAELAVVDRLVADLGAVSRSELIATAIEAHLTGSRRRSTR